MSVFTMLTRGSHLSISVSIRKKEKEKEGKRGREGEKGKRKKKRHSDWKGRSETLYADGMIIYVRNLVECSKKLVELIKMFSKIADDRSKQKNQIFFIHQQQSEIEMRNLPGDSTARSMGSIPSRGTKILHGQPKTK